MNQAEVILSARLKLLLSTNNASVIAGTLLALVLAYMQRGVIDTNILVSWLSFIALLAIARIALAYTYKSSPMIDYADLRARLVKFRTGVLITGIVWGSAGIWLFPENDPRHQMFLMFIFAGLTSGAVISYSADFVSSVFYSITTLAPISIRLLATDNSLSITMGFAILAYLVFTVISSRNINKNVIGNVVLNYETAARAEEARTSEERYRLLFNNSPFPSWVIDATNLKFLDVNERAVEHYGYSKEEFSQMSLRDIRPVEDLSELQRIISNMSNGKVSGELRHKKKDGTLINVDINSISINYGGIPARIGIVQDITARIASEQNEKKLSRAFRLLSKCESALVHADKEQLLFDEICRLVVEEGGYRMAWVGLAAMDASRKVYPIAQMGYEDGYLDSANITWNETQHGQGPVGTAIKTGSTVVIQDFQSNPQTALWREFAIRRRYHSCIALPLFVNKKVWGILSIYSSDAFAFSEEEIRLLEVLASDLSFGVQALRTRSEHADLLAVLQAEVEKNVLILRNASDGIHIFDVNGNIIEVSDSFCAMLGYSREELSGMNVSQWDANSSYDKLVTEIRLQVKNKTRNQFETRHRRKDGTIFEVEVSSFPLELDGKPVIFNSSRDISDRRQVEHQLQIAATAFESQQGMIITDANNLVLRVNKAFIDITGYTAAEVIGRNPKILSSETQNPNFYATMWDQIIRAGSWNGEVWDHRKNGELYPAYLTITAVKDSKGITSNYVAAVTDLSQRKADEDKINHLALFDQLTQLPNRRLLIDRLRQALSSSARSGHEGALLFIDLDNFKDLNDTLGHDKGDQLLQQVAHRLLTCVRETDTVARLGGDEFVVMLEELSKQPIEAASQIKSVGDKILATLRNSFMLGEHEYRCTTSIGATLFGNHFEAFDELLKQADIAMYQAKIGGRNSLRFFDAQMQDIIIARTSLEKDLHAALEQGQFKLHLQPQVDNSGTILGAEALIRWFHPQRGLVSPAQFIPLAEEIGLIVPIGEWVLDTACAQLKLWQQYSHTRNLDLSINVSAKQFRQPDFVVQVSNAINKHSIAPTHLKLELTEGMLVENIEEVIKTMTILKGIGIQFALDDFGTGYSSLQYLKRLPLDQIKIDQSFVREIASDGSDKAIVQSIIAMSQSLGVAIIAEGVETNDQQRILLYLGCNHFQGYLHGKPMPIEQFNDQLNKS
jgi:diguanylate cyclase (GGDEF)-like protein/PAS domain S-box-containing protein